MEARANRPPMHYSAPAAAIPVNNLDTARTFYGTLLGCEEGRSSKTWIDFNFFGHQLVTHWVGNEYRGPVSLPVAASADRVTTSGCF